jgi:hypothetical protein
MSFDPNNNEDDYCEMITTDPDSISLKRARQILPHAKARLSAITNHDRDILGKSEERILSKLVIGLQNLFQDT